MGVFFKDVLEDRESLFADELALDYDYVPKEIPYRENQQHYIADCIKPLFNKRSGRNLFVFGAPGIGKTLAIKHILRELENTTDDIFPLYVNCWKKDSSYKILMDICDQIGYKWTHNKRTDELMKVVSNLLNKKASAICLDEVDKVREFDVIYSLCEDLNKKAIIIIANDKELVANLDPRLRSRLMAEHLEFKPYNFEETRGILKQRASFAFASNAWENDALEIIYKKCYDAKDIRVGLFLMKEAGNNAEMKASKKINSSHAKEAISKLETFKIKNSSEFDEETQKVLDLVKNNSGLTVNEIYHLCEKEISYRTFHRKIGELSKNNMIELGEKKGKSAVVNYSRKLSDF